MLAHEVAHLLLRAIEDWSTLSEALNKPTIAHRQDAETMRAKLGLDHELFNLG